MNGLFKPFCHLRIIKCVALKNDFSGFEASKVNGSNLSQFCQGLDCYGATNHKFKPCRLASFRRLDYVLGDFIGIDPVPRTTC